MPQNINNTERNTNRRKRKEQDTHKKVSLFNACIFFGLIVLADIILIFSHGRAFSENENRMLQQAPALTASSITSGKFMTQFEDFISDQFFLRDNWIYTKLKMDRFLGRQKSNNVYLGKNGYLFEDTAVPVEEYVDRNIEAINSFADTHSKLKIVMTIVPNATEIYKKYVPTGAPVRIQRNDILATKDKLNENIKFVELLSTLASHKSEKLFYKSDHHWTSLGAYYAFEDIANAFDIRQTASFNVLTVSDDFSGTMAAGSGDFGVTDSVDIYVADPEVEYYMEYSGNASKYSSIYDITALENKNKYEVFFGGNYPKITITTLNNSGRRLLVLKDSYANCFIQFLLPYFDKIVIVDPRYYSDDLEADINEEHITDVLILYNENTFVQDNSLAGVLEEEF